MDPQVVLAYHVWSYLTIKEIGSLMLTCRGIRDAMVQIKQLEERLTKFLNNGLRVIQICSKYYRPEVFNEKTELYKHLLKRVKNRQPIAMFDVSKPPLLYNNRDIVP